ncbi:MAG: hypothetical protein AAFN81_17530 [Bacteroidota bacterium]
MPKINVYSIFGTPFALRHIEEKFKVKCNEYLPDYERDMRTVAAGGALPTHKSFLLKEEVGPGLP